MGTNNRTGEGEGESESEARCLVAGASSPMGAYIMGAADGRAVSALCGDGGGGDDDEGGEGSGDEGGEGGGGGGDGDDGDEETRATRGGRAGVARAALGVCPSGRGEGGPRRVPLRGVARATRPSGGSECGKSLRSGGLSRQRHSGPSDKP